MDNLNEMARLHSAGATVRHISRFDNLPAYQNNFELSEDFIRKWVIPYYMEIASYGNDEWINSIKNIKQEITKDISLSLLGDFNWRTRLVGSYFAAVKDHTDLIDIIGTHFLKSEVCCVGHIYALTLAFFNNEKSIYYLNTYLDYYLTKPNLYFDQEYAMEALLYLDKINGTKLISKHINTWKSLQKAKKTLEVEDAVRIANMLGKLEGQNSAERYMETIKAMPERNEVKLSTEYFDKQIPILRELNKHDPQ